MLSYLFNLPFYCNRIMCLLRCKRNVQGTFFTLLKKKEKKVEKLLF